MIPGPPRVDRRTRAPPTRPRPRRRRWRAPRASPARAARRRAGCARRGCAPRAPRRRRARPAAPRAGSPRRRRAGPRSTGTHARCDARGGRRRRATPTPARRGPPRARSGSPRRAGTRWPAWSTAARTTTPSTRRPGRRTARATTSPIASPFQPIATTRSRERLTGQAEHPHRQADHRVVRRWVDPRRGGHPHGARAIPGVRAGGGRAWVVAVARRVPGGERRRHGHRAEPAGHADRLVAAHLPVGHGGGTGHVRRLVGPAVAAGAERPAREERPRRQAAGRGRARRRPPAVDVRGAAGPACRAVRPSPPASTRGPRPGTPRR